MFIESNLVRVSDGSKIQAASFGNGNAGTVEIVANDVEVFETDRPSQYTTGIFAGIGIDPTNIEPSEGNGGSLTIRADNVSVRGGEISADTRGEGDAGNITLAVRDQLQVQNGLIATNSVSSSGGQIDIHAGTVILRGSSNIKTDSGAENGGNISIVADAVVALEDSNILAFAIGEGSEGGNIDLSQTTLFSKPLDPISDDLTAEEISTLTRNGQVDINATGGAASGDIFLNRTELVENSLTELSSALVNSDTLVANSCIARGDTGEGTFTLRSRDRIPEAPTDSTTTLYSSGTVQPIPTATQPTFITEPQAIYPLPDGRLVMSRDCEQPEALPSGS